MTKKKKMAWEVERPLPTGKILVAQLHRPGCPPCARHVGMKKLANTQFYSLKEEEGREEGDGRRSGVFLPSGKAAGCPGMEGGVGGAEPLMQRVLLGALRGTESSQARGRSGGYRATEQLTKQE